MLLRDDSLLLINGDQVLRVYRLLLAQVVLANGLDLSKELYFLLDGPLDRLLIFGDRLGNIKQLLGLVLFPRGSVTEGLLF